MILSLEFAEFFLLQVWLRPSDVLVIGENYV